MSGRKKAPAATRPRPKVRRALNRRLAAVAAVTGGLAVLGAGGYALAASGLAAEGLARARDMAVAGAARIGFRVEEVLVVGREETPQEEILAALALERGSPIFAFDAEAARRRVEAMPWVRRATVTRMLPATVVLKIEERRPLALWQNRGRFALIDREGQVILREGLERFARLPLVVGEDAPPHAAAILEALASEPELMKRMTAAIRVGGRRWNVRLDGGIDVQLPENDPAAAWKRLADYERTQGVLGRDVKVLDLRMPDRLIVRTAPLSAAGRDKQT